MKQDTKLDSSQKVFGNVKELTTSTLLLQLLAMNRTLFAIAAKRDYEIMKFDVKTAFL